MSRTARGHAAFRRGRWAERLAVALLWLKGYRLLGRNVRTPFGEIDLLARRGRVLAVIEVKARPDLATARAAISPHQQARLLNAVAWLVSRRPDFKDLQPRCDALLIVPGYWPRHVVNAFGTEIHF